MQSASRRVGEFLVERKVLSRDQLEDLLIREERDGVPLSKLLVDEHVVGEKDLVAAIAHQVGYPFVDFEVRSVNPQLERLMAPLPTEVAHRLLAVPVDFDGDRLLVAMRDPSDAAAVAELSEICGWPIEPALAARSELVAVVGAMTGSSVGGDDEAIELVMAEGDRPAPIHDVRDPGEELHVNDLLQRVVDLGGSDLHLTTGIHPSVRVNGEIKALTEFDVLTGSEIRRMLYAVLTQKQRERFESDLELDTSHSIPGVGRFRVNIFLQRDAMGAVMRTIPYEIVPLADLGLPPSVEQLAQQPRGLVLVTGPTGSGKSTTLASLVDIINSTKACHIMTVEDPIEFLHRHKAAVVNQREVGEDTHSFASALKHVLRQDPDVILVGEMRDLETISTALTAAETGHLVFATLHTQDAPQSVDRIIDVFPPEQQQQVRVQLASSLQGVVTQQLVPKPGGRGRAVACEVMIATPAIRNLIREGKTHQIYSAMQAGGRYGMQTMDQSLAALVSKRVIDLDMARERCSNEDDLRRLLAGGAS